MPAVDIKAFELPKGTLIQTSTFSTHNNHSTSHPFHQAPSHFNMTFQPINVGGASGPVAAGSGHQATGSGMGGGGGGGKKPSHTRRRGGNTGNSERELLLERIRQLLRDIINTPPVDGRVTIKLSSVHREFLTRFIAAYQEGRDGGLSVTSMFRGILKNPPAARWMDMIVKGGKLEMITEPHLATPSTLGATEIEPELNIAGGANYIPAFIAAGARGMEINSVMCDKCKDHGTNYFNGCYTVEGMFMDACLECAIDGHYENCSFSTHRPTPRNTRNRDHYNEQIEQQLQDALTSEAPDDPLAVAHRNRPLLPMYDSHGRPYFNPLPFNTPAVAQSPAGNALPHDNRYPIDFARTLPAMGAGSRHGMAVVHFNYPSGANRAQQQQHLQAALRNIMDNFMAVWEAGNEFNPGHLRRRGPEEDPDPNHSPDDHMEI